MDVKGETKQLISDFVLLKNSGTPETSKRITSVRKPRRRIITKNGNINILQTESTSEGLGFFQFTKIVDSSWTWIISVCLAILLSSWVIFAVVWWLICFTHGDFEPNHLPAVQKQNNFTPCVYEVHDFASSLIYSIATQNTVGYGPTATTDQCPEAIFVNALQCLIGIMMQGFMAVVIFTKMTLPRRRSKTLLFSKFATISLKDNQLCLMFRMGDMRENHIVDAKVRAYFVRSERTIEGEILKHNLTELELGTDNCQTSLFFNWPIVVVHKIDSSSSMYYVSPSDLLHDRFEIIVILEGTVQSTGQITQARTSYTSTEILWGRQFESLLDFNFSRREFEADFSKFDKHFPVSTPLCSAAYLDEYDRMNKYSTSVRSPLQIDFTPRGSMEEVRVKWRDNVISTESSSGTESSYNSPKGRRKEIINNL